MHCLSKSFPLDMSDTDFARLELASKIRGLCFEIEKADFRGDWTPKKRAETVAEIERLNASLYPAPAPPYNPAKDRYRDCPPKRTQLPRFR